MLLLLILLSLVTDSRSQNCTGSPHPLVIPHEVKIVSCANGYAFPYTRPIKTDNTAINIDYIIEQVFIKDLDRMKNEYEIEFFLRLEWYDYTNRWNPLEYGGLEHVILSGRTIWLPQLNAQYLDVDRTDAYLQYRQPAKVFYNGTVNWIVRLKKRVLCVLDLNYFPYDQQICTLNWVLHNQPISLIRFKYKGIHPHAIKMLDNEWELVSFYFVEDDRKHSSFDLFTHAWNATTIANRKSGYFNYFLLAPCVLIGLFSFLLPFLPIQSLQRFSLVTFLLMSLLAQASVILLMLPNATARVPIIVRYWLFDLLLLFLCYFTSLMSHHIFYANHRFKLHPFLRKIFLDSFLSYLTSSSLPSVPQPHDVTTQPEEDDVSDGGLKELESYLKKQVRMQAFYGQQLNNDYKQLAYVIERLIFFLLAICFVLVTSIIFGRKYIPGFDLNHNL